MKLLIAHDGSDCATAALVELGRAGFPAQGVDAMVVSVAEVWLPPPPPSSAEIVAAAATADSPAALQRVYAKGSDMVREADVLAQVAVAKLREHFPGWKMSADAAAGSPTWELLFKADEWQPDLIVVGSHGRTALGRLLLGSVSQKLAASAACSVRIARLGATDGAHPIRNLIAVDGTLGSDAAVRAVAERTWPAGTEAHVVVVDDPLTPTSIGRFVPPVTDWVDQTNIEQREWIEQLVKKCVQLLTNAGLKTSAVTLEGDPKRQLVAEAESWGADAIFVGSTGSSNRFERFLLGSVSSAVAARAHCSVEIVRNVSHELKRGR